MGVKWSHDFSKPIRGLEFSRRVNLRQNFHYKIGYRLVLAAISKPISPLKEKDGLRPPNEAGCCEIDRNGPFRFGPIFRNEISKDFVSMPNFGTNFEIFEIFRNWSKLIEISINFDRFQKSSKISKWSKFFEITIETIEILRNYYRNDRNSSKLLSKRSKFFEITTEMIEILRNLEPPSLSLSLCAQWKDAGQLKQAGMPHTERERGGSVGMPPRDLSDAACLF